MIKFKTIALIFLFIISLSVVIAQADKIEVTTTKDIFKIGESITLKVSLHDSQNSPVNDNVLIIIEDASKLRRFEETIVSNQFVDISIGKTPIQGYWTITASYKGLEAKEIFNIEGEELAEFSLDDDVLTIKNIGNTKYSKTIQIIIGDVVGVKQPNLNIGEEISYRLIAPEGTYSVRITDGSTTLTRDDVALTGNVIGILDERVSQKAPLTGTIRPENEENVYDSLRNNKLFYALISVIVGGAVLLIAERVITKKPKKKKK